MTNTPRFYADMERVVFLFDVDNTLIDNDRIAADSYLHTFLDGSVS